MPTSLGPLGPNVPLAYGTAGFRARAELLDSTFFRMGALAALRSRLRGGLAVGLMVTASHNPEPDNGIKLIDTEGVSAGGSGRVRPRAYFPPHPCSQGMLEVSWEAHATALANAPDDGVHSAIEAIATSSGVSASSGPASVLVARDTRSHSSRLASLALEGAGAMGEVKVEDFGVL